MNEQQFGFWQRPVNIEQIYLEMIEKIANDNTSDVSREEKVMADVQMFDIETIIDADAKYDEDIKALDEERRMKADSAKSKITGKINDNDVMKINYDHSWGQLKAIMRCLKRAGRFPTKGEMSFE